MAWLPRGQFRNNWSFLMTRPRLLLHIGSYKTGTSALQAFLSLNKAALAGRGLLYDLVDDGSFHHHAIACASCVDALRQENLRSWYDPALPDAAELVRQMEIRRQQVGAETIILSSETFYTTATIENHLWECGLSAEQCDRVEERQVQRLGELLAEYDVTVVCYLRRQDQWITSIYKQLVKQVSLSPSWDELIAYYDRAMQYDFQMARWARVFGRDRIQVRVYEKSRLPAGTIPDFLENVLHQELTPDFQEVAATDAVFLGNPSLNRDVLEFRRALSHLGRMDETFPFCDFTRVSIEMGGQDQYPEIVPPAARRELVCRHAEGNARVAAEYLGRDDGQLFSQPLPSPNDPYKAYPGLPVERAVEIGCHLWRLREAAWHGRLQSVEERLENLEATTALLDGESQRLAAQLRELRI
jgi:hypothetical protein